MTSEAPLAAPAEPSRGPRTAPPFAQDSVEPEEAAWPGCWGGSREISER